MKLRLPACILLVAVALLPGTHARSDDSPLDAQKEFAWFDTLGYSPVQNMEFARIYRGGWSQPVGKERIPNFEYGFVLKGRDSEFTAVGFNLWTAKLTSKVADKEMEAVRYVPADLEKVAHDLVKQRTDNRSYSFPADKIIPVESFVLARACAARGSAALAKSLLRVCDNEMRSMDLPEKNPTFRDRISDELSMYAIWRLTLDFSDIRISRAELLNRFNSFMSRFPNSRYAPIAVDLTAELTRMVSEDKSHATHAEVNVLEQPINQRVADLIYVLRNINSEQFSQPGACDVFEQANGKKSPASELAAIGLPAVSQIIDAVLDSRPTRSVEFWRDYCFSHHVVRVGDVALRILSLISGRGFYTHLDQKTHSEWLENAVSAQTDAKRWWKQVQTRGELPILIDGVERGDDESVGQAQRLVQRYPASVLPALAIAIRKSSLWIRPRLVQVAASSRNPGIVPVLREVANQEGDIDSRVEAAEELYKRGDRSVVSIMTTAWSRIRGDGEGTASLSRFITNHGSVSGIRALGRGLANRSADVRLAVVLALGDPDRAYSGDSERSEAAQCVLASLLGDKSAQLGMSCGFGDHQFQDPRICDAANATLAHLWPQAYKFTDAESRRDRDRECLQSLNAWRSRHGLTLLPLPAGQRVGTIPVSVIQPLLHIWEYGTNRSQVSIAEGRIRHIGLHAVPYIASEAPSVPAPLRNRLIALEKSLSCTVRCASVSHRDYVPSREVIKRVTDLQGTQLTSAECSRLVTFCLLHLPPRATGVRLSATRDNDGAGFQVDVSFLHSASFDTNRDGLRMSDSVRAGREQLQGGGGTTALMSGHPDGSDMDDDVKSIHAALESDPRVPVSIVIEREFEPKSH